MQKSVISAPAFPLECEEDYGESDFCEAQADTKEENKT